MIVGTLISNIKTVVKDAIEFHKDSPSAVFKVFISTVLVLFAVLSLVSNEVAPSVNVLPTLEKTLTSVNYWWGVLGLFGASSLLFEKYIKGNIVVLILGYSAAISSLGLLSYDFVTTKPPVHTGGILAATAVVFLGGLLYGRVKRG